MLTASRCFIGISIFPSCAPRDCECVCFLHQFCVFFFFVSFVLLVRSSSSSLPFSRAALFSGLSLLFYILFYYYLCIYISHASVRRHRALLSASHPLYLYIYLFIYWILMWFVGTIGSGVRWMNGSEQHRLMPMKTAKQYHRISIIYFICWKIVCVGNYKFKHAMHINMRGTRLSRRRGPFECVCVQPQACEVAYRVWNSILFYIYVTICTRQNPNP